MSGSFCSRCKIVHENGCPADRRRMYMGTLDGAAVRELMSEREAQRAEIVRLRRLLREAIEHIADADMRSRIVSEVGLDG